MRGKAEVKHPFFGIGSRDIAARHSCWLCAIRGCSAAGGPPAGGGACATAEAGKINESPDKFAATTIPRTVATCCHAELRGFMGCPPTIVSDRETFGAMHGCEAIARFKPNGTSLAGRRSYIMRSCGGCRQGN